MRVADLNWMQLEAYLERDDRIVLPLGSTEQHAYLSLATDNILAERVSVEAAEPLGVPVLPVLAYGVTPRFTAYPGSLSTRPDTYVALLRDLLGSLRGQGFRRVLIVNGHGGNSFAAEHVAGDGVRWHDWWSSDRQRELIVAMGDGSHASWMENFPWTRLAGRRAARRGEADGRRLDRSGRPPRCGPPSATARSGAPTSGPTKTWSGCGTRRSRR